MNQMKEWTGTAKGALPWACPFLIPSVDEIWMFGMEHEESTPWLMHTEQDSGGMYDYWDSPCEIYEYSSEGTDYVLMDG